MLIQVNSHVINFQIVRTSSSRLKPTLSSPRCYVFALIKAYPNFILISDITRRHSVAHIMFYIEHTYYPYVLSLCISYIYT